MNKFLHSFRSICLGLGLFAGGAILATAAPITGPIDPASLVSQINNLLLKWMSFPAAENGELQLLGPNAYQTAGSKVYLVTVDQTGTMRFILTATTADP